MNLVALKSIAGSMLSERGASSVAALVARRVPRPLQRLGERYFDYPIPASIRERGVLLIRVPKTASASLSLQLYGEISHHRPAIFYRDSDPAFFAAATTIAVVRHPVDRIVSSYNWLKQGGSAAVPLNPTVRDAMRRIAGFDHFLTDYVRPGRHALARLDWSLHEQHSYVCDERGAVIVDDVFRFERLDLLTASLRQHGIEARPPHVNRSEGQAGRLRPSDLSPWMIDEIRSIYARDFDLFGYS